MAEGELHLFPKSLSRAVAEPSFLGLNPDPVRTGKPQDRSFEAASGHEEEMPVSEVNHDGGLLASGVRNKHSLGLPEDPFTGA